MDILQALYDSEINFSLTTFWDGGFDAKLGDDMNGYVWEDSFDTAAEAIAGLGKAAREKYPDSTFAKSRSGSMTAPTAPETSTAT